MGKTYHHNSPGDDLIHVCRIRSLTIAVAMVIAAGVVVAFMQGGAA